MNRADNRHLPKVGFWKGPEESAMGCPDPVDFVDSTWESDIRQLVIEYLEIPEFESTIYRGMSTCRFCKKWNGNCDFTDGSYVWPQGFSHYLREHDVKPPSEFVEHVLRKIQEQL